MTEREVIEITGFGDAERVYINGAFMGHTDRVAVWRSDVWTHLCSSNTTNAAPPVIEHDRDLWQCEYCQQANRTGEHIECRRCGAPMPRERGV